MADLTCSKDIAGGVIGVVRWQLHIDPAGLVACPARRNG